MIQITIPKKTLTINHLYGFRGFRKFLKAEGRELREYIINLVEREVTGKFLCHSNLYTKLKVEVDIFENWLTKEGKTARKDIANREKFLIDSVFQALNIDDKHIWIHKMRKIQSTEEKAVIRIDTIE